MTPLHEENKPPKQKKNRDQKKHRHNENTVQQRAGALQEVVGHRLLGRHAARVLRGGGKDAVPAAWTGAHPQLGLLEGAARGGGGLGAAHGVAVAAAEGAEAGGVFG